MVMLWLPGFGEYRFLFVWHVITVGVGESPNRWRRRHDDLIAKHANAHRGINVAALVKRFDFVHHTVAGGVFQN